MGDSLDFGLLTKFLGFAINWIGGLAGLLIDSVVFFGKALFSRLEFCVGLFFKFLFPRFAWDCELVKVEGLLVFLSWFGIIFGLTGWFIGLLNKGFLFKFSLKGFPCKGPTGLVLLSLCCLSVSFFREGLLTESIFLSEFFLLIRFLIFVASSELIELLWLFTEIESFEQRLEYLYSPDLSLWKVHKFWFYRW